MKIIITLITIAGLQFMASSQTSSRAIRQPLKAGASHMKIGYVTSAEEPAKAKVMSMATNKEIIITRLPSLKVALTSVGISLEALGAISFKKSESLDIPHNCEVFIEDKLTHKLFNLKSSELCVFNVEEYVADRFVMHVLYKTSPGTLVTSGVIRGYKEQS